jgi:peptidoglycan/xylan/chitin deacetylase (PgdA/CDA1 family)
MIKGAIKRYGRRTMATMAHYSGYCALAARRNGRILSYHGVHDPPSNPYAISTLDFAGQMQLIAEQFTPVSVDQLVGCLRNGRPLPPRAVAVTIDDGYGDAYTHAFPILQRFCIPATVFLPVNFIETNASSSECDRSASAPTKGLAQTDFLTWDQVREMGQHGIAFGSHTRSHASLTSLPQRELRQELQGSKTRLEAALGEPVTGFAYPYGTARAVSPQVERAVADAGYQWAVTGFSGANDRQVNLYALRRIKVERGDSIRTVERAMRGALDPWGVVDRMGAFLPK